MTAGLHDSQVPYWEPLKWIARLRAHSTGKGPYLFRTELDGGHLANPRTAQLRAAQEYAFLLTLAGVNH
ncbi:Protease 2 [compost metagenome]